MKMATSSRTGRKTGTTAAEIRPLGSGAPGWPPLPCSAGRSARCNPSRGCRHEIRRRRALWPRISSPLNSHHLDGVALHIGQERGIAELGALEVRGLKVLNTASSTTAMTTHNRIFLVRSFNEVSSSVIPPARGSQEGGFEPTPSGNFWPADTSPRYVRGKPRVLSFTVLNWRRAACTSS